VGIILKNNIKGVVSSENLKQDAESTAKTVEGLTLEVKDKIGDSEKTFGAITTLMISDLLKDKEVSVELKFNVVSQ
jgi:ribosomal protein L9